MYSIYMYVFSYMFFIFSYNNYNYKSLGYIHILYFLIASIKNFFTFLTNYWLYSSIYISSRQHHKISIKLLCSSQNKWKDRMTTNVLCKDGDIINGMDDRMTTMMMLLDFANAFNTERYDTWLSFQFLLTYFLKKVDWFRLHLRKSW